MGDTFARGAIVPHVQIDENVRQRRHTGLKSGVVGLGLKTLGRGT